jgi:hypothetical protein
MTWITVPYACGHTHWQDLHGMELHRRRVLAAAQSNACPSCRASLARSVAEQEGLPPLQGSDRQIAWAHPIRTEAMAQAGALSCEMDRAEKTLQDPERWPQGLKAEEAARRLAAAAALARSARQLVDRSPRPGPQAAGAPGSHRQRYRRTGGAAAAGGRHPLARPAPRGLN